MPLFPVLRRTQNTRWLPIIQKAQGAMLAWASVMGKLTEYEANSRGGDSLPDARDPLPRSRATISSR